MATPPSDASNLQITTDQEQVETSLAFTVQLDDPKPDGRKLKIHDKLSSFALKHRRNPSLPEFKAVKTAKSLDSAESKPSPLHKFGKHFVSPKAGYHSEGYFSSDQDEESIKQRHRNNHVTLHTISPVTEDKGFVPEVNGTNTFEPSKNKKISNMRRSSMNDIDMKKMIKPKLNSTYSIGNEDEVEATVDGDKSDTVSEAGTYTVEKEESPEGGNEDDEEVQRNCRKTLTPENHKWINDWVKKVVEENLKEPSNAPLSASGSSSASASKIPSPVNTMPKIREPVITRRSDRISQQKTNGVIHRRSSSLSAKDIGDNRMSDSSLETESYLMATESVVVAMQSRMRQSLKLNLGPNVSEKGSARKERLHPPSTASDTDTNSDNDAKVFKKPTGAPFSSARLNRAFSLRRAKADVEVENVETKKRNAPTLSTDKKAVANKTVQSSKPKPSANNSAFARTDGGRFSMRSTISAPKATPPSVNQKKDGKKGTTGGRSNSSLSPREMEFQNWKRRKSFDPMKAAAEGRKKEAAKKAAVTHNIHPTLTTSPSANMMTQSVNLGTTLQTRGGNSVLRSASFHVSPQLNQDVEDEDDDPEEEPSSPISSCCYNQPVLPPNSPSRVDKTRALSQGRTSIGGSRGSLNSGLSEIHSSPSHRARAELIDNLLVSAISELSIGLKIKSADLLKKLDEYYDGDDRITRMREELACSERGSTNSSPARKNAPRDFPAILKNLKTLDSVLQLMNEVLFDGPTEEE